MKIRELSLKNYRSFEDCTIQFEDYYTAICGKNNSGKSNILRAVLNTLERSRHYERFNYNSDFPVWKTQEKGEDIEICLKLHLDSQADTGLIKFILDNVKFYIPDYFNTLKLNYDRSFVVHRSVSKIVKIYRNDFKRDRAEIEFTGTSSSLINGDKEYFEILIKILIENALKYSEFPKRIGPKVNIVDSRKEINIEVKSYGRSIPKTEQPYLFSRGFRSSANKKLKEGTGMGLYNAIQLANHFKSDIKFSQKKASKDNDIDLAWNIFTLKINKSVQQRV